MIKILPKLVLIVLEIILINFQISLIKLNGLNYFTRNYYDEFNQLSNNFNQTYEVFKRKTLENQAIKWIIERGNVTCH